MRRVLIAVGVAAVGAAALGVAVLEVAAVVVAAALLTGAAPAGGAARAVSRPPVRANMVIVATARRRRSGR